MLILMLILIFSVIVIAHEWGHYIMARKCGVLVNEFAIGMGPLIWSKQVGETQYSIRLLPIGGYCMMEQDLECEGISKNKKAFQSKKPFQKFMILVAGAVMNFILAWVLCSIVVAYRGEVTNIINEVQPDSPAATAGLMHGDKIISVDGNEIKKLGDVTKLLENNPKIYSFTIIRNGEVLTIPVESKIIGDETSPRFGFSAQLTHGNLVNAIVEGFNEMINLIVLVWGGVVQLVTGKLGVNDMAGVVGIVDMGATTWNTANEQGGLILAIMSMLNLAAVLSANLGVMNLLPFPALDGGRIIFVIIEMIQGKPVSQEKEGVVHFIGMVLLMILMAVILYNDVMNWGGRM